jgi:hypothetical protein
VQDYVPNVTCGAAGQRWKDGVSPASRQSAGSAFATFPHVSPHVRVPAICGRALCALARLGSRRGVAGGVCWGVCWGACRITCRSPAAPGRSTPRPAPTVPHCHRWP